MKEVKAVCTLMKTLSFEFNYNILFPNKLTDQTGEYFFFLSVLLGPLKAPRKQKWHHCETAAAGRHPWGNEWM